MVPAGDPAGLAAALSEVLSDRALRRRLVAGGRTTAARFTWEAAAAAHEQVYEEIVRVAA
jgi:glycosyltransferase involved in cell wall biosynthesis